MADKSAKARIGLVCLVAGIVLVAASLSIAGYNWWDEARAGRSARAAMETLTQNIADAPARQTDVDFYREMEMPVKTIDGVEYIGVLRIPALELELPIISRWSDSAMKIAPCRYSGSAYQNNLILCGHNYTTHFGKLDLLQAGDTVCFEDAEGNEFSYQVSATDVLPGTAVEEMQAGEWDLTLFTCTWSGSSRLCIRCEAVE